MAITKRNNEYQNSFLVLEHRLSLSHSTGYLVFVSRIMKGNHEKRSNDNNNKRWIRLGKKSEQGNLYLVLMAYALPFLPLPYSAPPYRG